MSTTDLDLSALPLLDANQLLKRAGIDASLNDWRSLMAFYDAAFDDLIRVPFYRYVEAVQLCPASEADHHACPGGLLAHTYDVISLALKRRRGMQLPLGGTVEQIRDQRHLWTYAIFAAGLLHDIGKLMGSIRICLRFKNKTQMLWTPQDKPLKDHANVVSYSVEFIKTPYSYHTQVALTAFDFLPQSGRAWLARDQTVMMQLCAYLRGDRYESGVIGDILEYADMSSTATAQLRPTNNRFSNRPSTIERLIHFVRRWIAEDIIKINKNGGMAWCTGEHIYIVCRALADKIINHCDDSNITDLPRDPVRLYDILQDYGFAIPTPEGKAIWNVVISCPDYTHRFTCLKFSLRRLVVPTRIPKPFDGSIEEVAATLGKKLKPPVSSDSTAAEVDSSLTDSAEIFQLPEPELSGGSGDDGIDSAEEIVQEADHTVSEVLDAHEAEPEWDHDAETVYRDQEPDSLSQEAEPLLVADSASDIAMEEDGALIFRDTVEIENSGQDTGFAETLRDAAETESYSETAKSVAKESADDNDQETAERPPIKKPYKKNSDKKFGKYLVSGVPAFEPGVVAMDADQLAGMFIRWLRENITHKTIAINNTEALVHVMEDCVLVLSPGIFKCFLEVHGIDGEGNHKPLSRKVRLLRKHIKAPDDLNIHTIYAIGKNKTTKLHGWKFPHNVFYSDTDTIPAPNTYIKNEPGFTESKKS